MSTIRRIACGRPLVLAAALCLLAGAAKAADAPAPGPPAATTLDVLTYNIEGVPRRGGRRADLADIAGRLRLLNAQGRAPDVVLFQEAFSRSARAAVRDSGYPHVFIGPGRKARRGLEGHGARSGSKWRKGELGVKLVGSGLAIASRYPITAQAGEPFSRRACAGFDCLSNKGGAFVRLLIPGAPQELDVFNTHLNAQRASGVGVRRYNQAHLAQSLELSGFMRQRSGDGNPILLGGDFNMRRSPLRFEAFEKDQKLRLVHQYCLEARSGCDVRMSWDGDAPWMDTQDLQFFGDGERVRVRPVRVEAMFDGRPDSPRLSDHDGLRVIYELSWNSEAQ